jgi:hypothetical protein
MAAIDGIFGTFDQWCEFHHWVATSKRPQYCKYFYPTPLNDGTKGLIANTPVKVDIWLYNNCSLEWVKERLEIMHNGVPGKNENSKWQSSLYGKKW